MLKNGKDKTISIRLSQPMLEALDARAVLDEKDRTQVIREAIIKYLELAEDSIEERVNYLQQNLEEIQSQIQRTEKKTDSIEIRVHELTSLMAVYIDRFRK